MLYGMSPISEKTMVLNPDSGFGCCPLMVRALSI